MNIVGIYACIKELYYRFIDDEVTALSAQMAYYFLLSLFPFLIFFITLLGYSPVSYDFAIEELKMFLPENAYLLLKNSIIYIVGNRNKGFISFGLITSLWAASNGAGAVIRALNKAYDEQEKRPFWKVKGITVLFTIVLAFIIIFSFILLIFAQQIWFYISLRHNLPAGFKIIWDIFRYLIMLIIMVFFFAALYKYMPCRKLQWQGVISGAIFATLGWIITSLGFSYYVNNFSSYSKLYGSIGGVMVLLIWLFLSAIVIILGGELNATLAFDKEGKRKPKGKRY